VGQDLQKKENQMNEYLWSELINHRHDIIIPILVIVVILYHYLDRWYLKKQFEEMKKILFEIFDEVEK
jgi:hypothetical protein